MELKVACSSSQPAEEESTENIDDMFRKLESVEEIVSKLPDFDIEGEKVFCKVCAKMITTYSQKFPWIKPEAVVLQELEGCSKASSSKLGGTQEEVTRA